ncbi:MAG: hypothetical protein Sapg2KO_00900 [Saprospiraceae bacterium]
MCNFYAYTQMLGTSKIMKTSIEKGREGEEYVNDLAYKSFFKYWCYPNPLDEKGDKKEICDLLVLFKNICVIVSVKNYKNTGNITRYIKKTVGKSIKQISGAERKLFSYPRDVFIKHPNREIEQFQRQNYEQVYRLIVNVGDSIEMQVLEAKTTTGELITVFNRDIFDAVMLYLDTISDFVDYLKAREVLLNKFSQSLMFGTENDLLAVYLENQRTFPDTMTEIDADMVVLDLENKWKKFQLEFDEKIRRKRKDEKASRILDVFLEDNLLTAKNGPSIVKEYLSLNRLQRRMFSNSLQKFIELHKGRKSSSTGHRNFSIDNFGVSFFYHGPEVSNESFVETVLQAIMVKFSMTENHSNEHLLGLGINENGGMSKVGYINSRMITKEIEKTTEQIIKELGWFKNVKKKTDSIEEYPEE